jgi:negative regulator of flagellin synthesis FlgM
VVDPIGARPVSPLGKRIAPVAPSAAATAPASVDDDHSAAPIAGAARAAAQAAPVDSDRVSRLRAAIADGTYQPSPEKIADRLIAAKQEWTDR